MSPPRSARVRIPFLVGLLACVLAGWNAACATGGGQAIQRLPRRAALATVFVDNRTADTLTVEFQATAEPAAPVMIGRVPPGSRSELAPVLAAEPIVLTAVRSDGRLLRLPPRSLEIDEEWIWLIPSHARFERPEEQ